MLYFILYVRMHVERRGKMKKKNVVIILVVVLLIVVLVGGYFIVTNKLVKTANNGSSNMNSNEQKNDINNGEESIQNNLNSIGINEQEATISESGEVLEFALGRLVVDTTGEVYYITSDDTNLGSEKVYTTKVYQTQPDSYEFMGYKLNVSNIRSLYAVYIGNGREEYPVFMVDKNGNLSAIKFTVNNGVNIVSEEIKLTKYKDIVSVVPSISFGGRSALAIDKNGNLYSILEVSDESEVTNVTDTRSEVLEFTFGMIIIDTTGEVYYEPNSSAKMFGDEVSLSDKTKLGSMSKYTTKSYETGPNYYEFSGYKLKYSDIKSAYAAYLGNGAENEYVFLLDKSGNVFMLKFGIENGSYDILGESKLTQYKDIVSVVPSSGFGGSHALAIDKNGNLYDLWGE